MRRGCRSSRCPSRGQCLHAGRSLFEPAPRVARGPRVGPGPATRRPHTPSRDRATPRRRSAEARAPTPCRASARSRRAPADGRGPWPSGVRRCPWQGALRRPRSPRPIPLAALPPGPHSPGILSERGDLHMARRAWSCGAYRSRRRRAAGKRLGDAQGLEGKRRWSPKSYSPAAGGALPPPSRRPPRAPPPGTPRPSPAPCLATESAPQASSCGGGARGAGGAR